MNALAHPARAAYLALSLLAAAGVFALRTHLDALPKDEIARQKEVMMVPPGEVLKRLDLGHHSLMADLLFIRANLYYGQHILTDEEFPWLQHLIEVMLSLDPDFKKAYLWAAMVTTFNRRQLITLDEAAYQRANAILARGMARFPGDHRFPLRIAFNLYYDLGRTEEAMPYFERAASLPGAPRWIRQKLIDLYSKRGDLGMAERVLRQLVAEAEDPVLAQGLRDRLALLTQKASDLEDVRRTERLIKDWEETLYYVPFPLYLTIREP
jgi:tetratricopeptide (TPR) repeat protein